MKSLFENGKQTRSINGAAYFGVRINASYNQLVKILGPPHSTMNDKSFNTWFYENSLGEVCYIYDSYRSVCPSQYPEFEFHWHIGGFNWLSCMYMQEDLEKALRNVPK